MFEEPERLERDALLRAGAGAADDFDSLEKAQWRKFKDAIDWVAPAAGDTRARHRLRLRRAASRRARRALVRRGSSAGRTRRTRCARARSCSRTSIPRASSCARGTTAATTAIYDHVLSTGMISHVGPRGLVPYVRAVRRRIRRGGRYLHHALMTPHTPLPLDFYPGTAFHKRWVWPGYHWFTFGSHVRALERNGFEVHRAVNLSLALRQDHGGLVRAHDGAARRRRRRCSASRPSAPGGSTWPAPPGNFRNKGIHVYRLYCEAV